MGQYGNRANRDTDRRGRSPRHRARPGCRRRCAPMAISFNAPVRHPTSAAAPAPGRSRSGAVAGRSERVPTGHAPKSRVPAMPAGPVRRCTRSGRRRRPGEPAPRRHGPAERPGGLRPPDDAVDAPSDAIARRERGLTRGSLAPFSASACPQGGSPSGAIRSAAGCVSSVPKGEVPGLRTTSR